MRVVTAAARTKRTRCSRSAIFAGPCALARNGRLAGTQPSNVMKSRRRMESPSFDGSHLDGTGWASCGGRVRVLRRRPIFRGIGPFPETVKHGLYPAEAITVRRLLADFRNVGALFEVERRIAGYFATGPGQRP